MTSTAIVLNEKEQICLCWAANGLAYEVIDDPTFKVAFKASIPLGGSEGVVCAHVAFGGKNEGHAVRENSRPSRDIGVRRWNHPQETAKFVPDRRAAVFLLEKHPGLPIAKNILVARRFSEMIPKPSSKSWMTRVL